VFYGFATDNHSGSVRQEIAMTLTLLLIGGITIAIVAVSVVSSRAYEVVEPVLVGETTGCGLADPATETMVEHNGNGRSVQTDWNLATVSALCDAEDMLDSLENQGYSERELMVLGNSCFAVRWR
jgi:hypothetical protein